MWTLRNDVVLAKAFSFRPPLPLRDVCLEVQTCDLPAE